MNSIVGQTLPLALGIAISPVAIMAAIMMLLSVKAKQKGASFLSGWVIGVLLMLAITTLFGGFLPASDTRGPHFVGSILQIVIGGAMLLLAWRQWNGQLKPVEERKLPKWMDRVEETGSAKAIWLGFYLAAADPKNWLLAASAGISISSSPNIITRTFCGLIFVGIAVAAVAFPVIYSMSAPDKLSGILHDIRGWLLTHNAAVLTAVMVVLGADIIGMGISGV